MTEPLSGALNEFSLLETYDGEDLIRLDTLRRFDDREPLAFALSFVEFGVCELVGKDPRLDDAFVVFGLITAPDVLLMGGRGGGGGGGGG